jgi:hypothetical protein
LKISKSNNNNNNNNEVCFFDDANFGGQSECFGSGQKVNDLANIGAANVYTGARSFRCCGRRLQ